MKTRQICERLVRSMGIAFAVGGVLCTSAFAAQCPEGMLSYWKFDGGTGQVVTVSYPSDPDIWPNGGFGDVTGEIVTDSVGPNHAALVNGPVWTTGIVGGGLQFDGIDDYVALPPEAGTIMENHTIEFWMKSFGLPGYRFVFLLEDRYPGDGHGYYGLYQAFSYPHNLIADIWTMANGDWQWVTIDSGMSYADTAWHHVCFTKESATYRLYIDGNLVGTATNPNLAFRNTKTHFFLGSLPHSSFYPLDQLSWAGVLDELALYNRALAAEEIRRHYEAGLAGKGYCEATPQDTTPPTISCPSNVTLAADPQKCTASNVGLGLPDASDDSGQVSVGNNAPTEFPVGQTVVTWTATDPSGNSASCSQTVTVLPRLRVMFVSPLEDDNVDDDIGTDADAANRFKVGSTVPHKVRLVDCNGKDVTASVASLVSVKLNVTLRDAGNSSYVVDLPESYTGAGGPGGLMVLSEGSFQYNLKTTGYESGTVNSSRYFRSHVTVSYNSDPTIIVGEEDATLESR